MKRQNRKACQTAKTQGFLSGMQMKSLKDSRWRNFELGHNYERITKKVKG